MTLGTGIAGGLILRGELYRGAIGARRGARAHGDRDGRSACQGNCPNHGCVEAFASGTALAREARRLAGEQPDSGSGARGQPGARARRSAGHRAGPRRRSGGDRGDRADRHAARGGDRQPGQHLQPGGGGDRRRRDRPPASCCWSRPGPRWLAARCRRRVTSCGSSPARFGVEAGMVGAAALAFDGLAAGQEAAAMSGRLVVCPTPIGNLEDITLRVLAALREADLVACEDTRRTGSCSTATGSPASSSAITSTTSARAPMSWWRACAAGAVVALVSDAGMPLVSDPGLVLVRACVAAGLGVEVLPGPSAALSALVASALPADRWRFVGFLPRKRGELERVLRLARDAGGVRVAAPGGGVTRGAGGVGSRPAGGGVPGADQAARGGRARQRRRARRALSRGRPQGGDRARRRSCGSARRSTSPDRCAAAHAGWSTRAPSRARPPRSWPSSPARAPTPCIAR